MNAQQSQHSLAHQRVMSELLQALGQMNHAERQESLQSLRDSKMQRVFSHLMKHNQSRFLALMANEPTAELSAHRDVYMSVQSTLGLLEAFSREWTLTIDEKQFGRDMEEEGVEISTPDGKISTLDGKEPDSRRRTTGLIPNPATI